MVTTEMSETGQAAIASATLDEAMIEELLAYGDVRSVEPGEILYRAGDPTPDFFVVLEGEAEIVRQDDTGDVVVATHGAARFLGELNLLTGQRAYLTARVSRSRAACSRSSAQTFRRMMSSRAGALRRDLPRVRRAPRAARARERVRARSASSGRATRPRRWRCARSRTARGCRTRGSTSKTSTTPAVLLASIGVRPRRHAGRASRPPAMLAATRRRASSPTHLGLTYRQTSRVPLRSRRGRHRTGRARGGGVRRVRRPRHDLARRGRASAGRPARARASRTTSASRTVSRART